MRFSITFLVSIFISITVHGQQIAVYEEIPNDRLTASASSAIDSSPAKNAINGSGMIAEKHVANNLGEGMWVSAISRDTVQYRPGTHSGKVWFLCSSSDGMPVSIDQVRIWNHNQNEHTRRGLNKVYIEYSLDGKTWSPVKDGKNDYHYIPESKGKNPEPADYIVDMPGTKLRYLCITAACEDGNHYDMNDPVIALETKDMNQNPDYYGLAEIRFYKEVKKNLAALPQLHSLNVSASQGYLKTPQGPSREFRIVFNAPIYAGAEILFINDGKKWTDKIAESKEGIEEYSGLFPAGYMEEASSLNIRIKSPQGLLDKTEPIPAARKWEVHFFPHSHQDIGYTHRQEDVMKLQWRNLERAIDLAERTAGYPEGSRFRWNSETTWSVIGYLRQYAGTEKAGKMIEAIRKGVISIDASLGSILTGISRQEELNHYFDDAHEIEKITGIKCNTAMMSDVPGQVWGLVNAMHNNEIKYFSPAPNYVPFYGRIGNDRAAAIHLRLGDNPFYWQSESGKDSVLVWSAGRGYSWFHGWLAGRLSVCGLDPIWEYLGELENEEFPYDRCYLRYTVHGDNGPPDEKMPDTIREWNEKYDSPKFYISSASDFFKDFEKEYGEVLPVYRGDMTPTWEDGAASTARETIMNRKSSARLAKSSTLWSMLRGVSDYPSEDFAKAWKNIVLFSEHTWGAAGSGHEPYSDFTKELWNTKKSYADSADIQSKRLERQALSQIYGTGEYLHVINTNLWPRTDIVFTDIDLTGKSLTDEQGKETEVQLLHDGRWAFIAEDVPALSSKVYKISNKRNSRKKTESFKSMINGNSIDNGLIHVKIDSTLGTVNSIKMKDEPFEYVNGGINEYLYTGRIAKNPRGIDKVTAIEKLDDGPIVANLRIVSEAPGCNKLYRDVILYKGIGRVDIINSIDKQDILDFENVRFIFPFNFSYPEITMDMAMCTIHPERDQLAGANKNYWSVLNGLSVGDLEHGIRLATPDAPFIELGSPSGEDYRLNPRYGYGWRSSAEISPVIYSWVMTNTWRTNYKASQGGMAVFRYSLSPGNPFDLGIKKFGSERENTMTTVTSSDCRPVPQLFRLKGKNEIAVSEIKPSKDGQGYIIRLQNMSAKPVQTAFIWGSLYSDKVFTSNHKEDLLNRVNPDSLWLEPYEYKIIKVITN